MGNSSSSTSTVETVKSMLESTPNTGYGCIVNIGERTYIFVGEDHINVPSSQLPILSMFEDLCGKVNADIFVEVAYEARELYRYRYKTSAETKAKIEELQEHGADSLQLQREAAKLNCESFRVHAVDVRDLGFMNFFFRIYNFISDKSPAAANAATECYSLTLQNTLDYVKKIARKSLRKSVAQIKPVVRKSISSISKEVKKLAWSTDIDSVWDAYSKLVDIYLMARMARTDNHSICFYYGGENHARRCADVFKSISGADLKFEYDASTM